MRYINLFLIILAIFCVFLCFTFYSRGEYIKKVADYDVNQVHVNIHELNKDYNYCPYCGEYIGAESEKDKR